MLTEPRSQIWDEFLQAIAAKSSPVEFKNWIAPIKLLSINDEKMVLKAPNIFVREYLLQNYRKELATYFPMDKHGELAIDFVIAEESKPLSVRPTPSTLFNEDPIRLNPLYTFPNFIEGASNQFVKSAALAVAAHPGKSYSPLFIYGGVGLGKTHLLHAIGHYVKSNHKKLKIECITIEEFINVMVAHLKNKSMDRMKRHYRSLDLLLVDDIQFLTKRLGFEEEICNTFESLIQQQKQIVITSDQPPSELKLSKRLIDRMEWGLVSHLQPPDLETRVAILQHKAELRNICLPHKIAFFIAHHIYQNVRQLEGAINRLSAYAKLMEREVTEEVVERALGELFLDRTNPKEVSTEAILRSVSTIFEVRISDIKGNSRLKQYTLPRQIAMYLAKELVSDPLIKLASAFGGKTHSTLLHAWKKIRSQIESDSLLKEQISTLRRTLSK